MATRASGPSRRIRLRRTWRRGLAFLHRHGVAWDGLVLLAVTVLAVGLALLSTHSPRWVPLASLTVPIIIGGFLLTRRSLVLLFGVTTAVVAFATWDRLARTEPVRPGVVVVLVATCLLVLVGARPRFRLGVAGARGEAMLVDLRDRLRAHGELPVLPSGWEAEVVLRSAYGASFSGDFLVAARSRDLRTLEVAVVDVSGKGVDAGTRALLLSGAFGGLLGALPGESFLPAANQYLLRQQWAEGFATAVHLVLDLRSGDFRVTSAGHPPAAQFVAGSGRWRVIETTRGPVLGVIDSATYVAETGRLDRGDALLLYTDGLVETPGRDLSEGIDRLLGEAERLVPSGFRDGARRLVDSAGGESDDRALVVIWRD